MPWPELTLWSKLKNKQLCGYKFRRQYGVGLYIIDFYCPELKLAIEIDGESHFGSEKTRASDLNRQKYIESFGIKLVRFTNTEVNTNLSGVMQKLESILYQ
jgi:very-short-patch-repair endonuclease